MSTRKSTNKQNSTSPVALTAESTSGEAGVKSISKVSQDVGSESEPTTPTSKDSNITIGSETKRRRRPNSILNTPTTKKSVENEQQPATSDKTDTKSTKISTEDCKVDDKEKEKDNISDSPSKRQRKVFDKSAIITRKTAMSLVKGAARPQRTITVRKASLKQDSTKEIVKKRKYTKRTELSLPVKRKREDSAKSDEDKRPEKIIKLEKTESVENIAGEDLKKQNNETETAIEEDNTISDVSDIKMEAKEDTLSDAEEQDPDTSKTNVKTQAKTRGSNKQQQPLAKDIKKVQKEEQVSGYEKPKRGRPKKIVVISKEIEIKKEPSSPKNESDDIVEPSKSPVPEDKGPIEETPKDGKLPDPPILEKETLKESTLEKLDENNPKPEDNSTLNGIEKPLTVDTTTTNSIALEKEKTANTSSIQDSDKAASLSPELVSEGVSEISVKQFYKEPEFLENNLGIEKDPKLGEIVQKVEAEDEKSDAIKEEAQPVDEIVETISQTTESEGNGEGDSLKEGELLILEDSTEEETSKQSTPISTQVPMEEDVDVEGLDVDVENDNTKTDEINEKDCKDEFETVEILKIVCDSKAEDEDVDVVNDTDNSFDKEDTITEICTDINIKKTECDVEPEVPKNNSNAVILNSENEKKSDDELSNENGQGEIDSGVSDVAENNSSDPHEDINSLFDEKIESDVKNESDVDCDNVKSEDIENKENIESDCDIKENKENIQMDSSIAMDENCDNSQGNKNIPETPETLKQKENHLKTLGLLTHQAACEAKIEKQRRRQLFLATNSNKKSNNGSNNNNSNVPENGNKNPGSAPSTVTGGNGNKNSQEYTGTLKTVIKLNRQTSNTNDKRKTAGCSNANGGGRQPLKMTFQKGRGRGAHVDKGTNSSTNSFEDSYYTIQNETETPHQESTSHGRKSHNRSHNTESGHSPEAQVPTEKKEEKEIIVIPEKASSFSIHPGRLCQDQCFYCGGKFGLYDTPCHIAQLKSAERQKKILETEEKLTVDNCLCDACFRHVDRRANVPSYKKRLSAPPALESNNSVENDTEGKESTSPTPVQSNTSSSKSVCLVTNCEERATHSLRRKGFRKTIKKLFGNDVDLSTLGALIPFCDKHYEKIIQYLECALCKRRLVKNHMYHITQDIQALEKLLSTRGIPVQLHNNPAVCKLCRYYTNLLLKPPEGKSQKAQFVKNYQRRLLNFHNIQSPEVSDGEEQTDSKNVSTASTEQPVKRGRKPKKVENLSRPESAKTSCDEGNSTPPLSEDGSTEAPSSHTASGQMMLDNDVMVDYDVPMISDSPSPPVQALPSKLQTILQSGSSNRKDDISKALRSNPNISMRELFPGEEEMGLQINLPFGGSASQRTPEGWTRVQTFLQYDEPTRRLWEYLQKPYGNQSSFLRHLILLEKYFRNGDLILSQNASTNAVVYSDTVQNRLKSFDSGISASGSTSSSTNSRPTISQLLQQSTSMQQFNNLPITITARPKQPKQQQANTNTDSDSILKTNLLGRKNSAIEILPIGGNNNADNSSMSKQEKILAAASRLVNSDDTSIQGNTQKNTENTKKTSSTNSNVPPELISINRNQNSLLITRNKPSNQNQSKPGTSKSSTQIIKLPNTLSPHERVNSKSWRPSLIPVTQGALANQSGVLYETADGRKLPGLVQVLSGGRPFLISIHDYNRMCILRREKLQREQMLRSGGSGYGSNKHSSTGNDSKSDSETNNRKNQQQSQGQQNKMQIPNKLLEQNTVFPIGGSGGQNKNSTKKLNQTSLLKAPSYLIPIAPKPSTQLQILPQTIVSSNSQQQQQSSQQQKSQQPAHNPAGGNTLVSFLPAALSLSSQSSTNSSTSWLWSNFSDSNNTQMNGSSRKSSNSLLLTNSSKSSALNVNQQQQLLNNCSNVSPAAAIVLDNTLLSKIPKSLTVIPQQKKRTKSADNNSIEDLTSA